MPLDDEGKATSTLHTQRFLLEFCLHSHHCCLREDATNPDLERLTLAQGRVPRMPEVERELERTTTSD